MSKYGIFIFLFIFLLSGCVSNKTFFSYQNLVHYPDLVVHEIISVYDGDTFRANLDTNNMSEIISKNISIRIYGIDTPEMRGTSKRLKKKAIIARDYVSKRLREGDSIILKNVQRGMYFRIIAEVEIDGVSLTQELIDLGYAKPYFGGSKRGLWDARFKRKKAE